MKYLILLLLTAGAFILWSCKAKVAPVSDSKPVDQAQLEKMWKTIDSLENKGLISSALDEVQRIKKSALAGNESGHLFKAIMHENKYFQQLEEDAAIKAIERGESELATYPEPVRSVMHSLLAEWYSHYLRGHLWEFRSRTEYGGPAGPDIRTWGIRHFVVKIQEHYKLSVQWDGLKASEVKPYELLLTADVKTDELRPTLFDILMHRALDFYSGNETWLTKPAYDFVLTDPIALSSASEFAKHVFITEDSLSSTWNTIQWFQELLSFRLTDQNHVSALLDADLKRLQYVYHQMLNDQKDSLYANSLKLLSDKHKGNAESTLVDYYRAEWLINKASEWQTKRDSTYRYAYNEAMQICSTAIAKFPDAYGTQLCKSLMQQIEAKSLSTTVESINLPNEELLAHVDYRNLDLVHFRIVKLPQSPRRWRGESWDGEEVLKKLIQLPALKSWEQILDNGKDHQPHATEIALPALPVGHYALIVSDSKDPDGKKATVGTVMFTVSSLAYWYMDDRDQEQKAAIINRATGLPLQGVKVEFISLDYNESLRKQEEVKLGEAISDAKGWVDVPAKSGKNLTIRLTKGEDELFPDDAYYSYNSNRNIPDRSTTLFFSDRAIYRPGQKMYFKGYAILFDADRIPSIVPNKKVEIILYDANGQEVNKQTLQSNAFGTFAGHFDLPSGGLTGQMSVSSSHGSGRHYFRVEEYKRPKFEITFDTVRENVRLNQEVVVKANALDYAGSAVSGATTGYRVERISRRPWWWFQRGFWPGSEDRQVLSTGKGFTANDGSFDIPFVAKSKPGDYPDMMYNFEVTVYVTDITGETHEATKTLTINQQGYEVQVSLEERVSIDKLKTINIAAHNSDGAEVKVNGQVEVSRITGPTQNKRDRLWSAIDILSISDQEYSSRFSNYHLPGKEHMSSWPADKVIGKRLLDINGKGLVDISTLITAPGFYKLNWTWKDVAGKELVFTQYIMAYQVNAPLPGYEVNQVVYVNKAL